MKKYEITLPDRQLACAPTQSPEGKAYLGAMCRGGEFRLGQPAGHDRIFCAGHSSGSLAMARGIEVIYDVCHNIAKRESYEVDGRKREVLVHRKGATRAFPAGTPGNPAGISRDRTARLYSGQYGDGFMGAGRSRRRHARNLRQLLSRRGPAAQPQRRARRVRTPGRNRRSWKRPASWCAASRATASWRNCRRPIRMSTK